MTEPLQQSYNSSLFSTSPEEAKEIAKRLMSRYGRSSNGTLQSQDMSVILGDIYSKINVPYQPASNDNLSFMNTLDTNKDNQITLEDMEKACIRILCKPQSTAAYDEQIKRSPITTPITNVQYYRNQYTSPETVKRTTAIPITRESPLRYSTNNQYYSPESVKRSASVAPIQYSQTSSYQNSPQKIVQKYTSGASPQIQTSNYSSFQYSNDNTPKYSPQQQNYSAFQYSNDNTPKYSQQQQSISSPYKQVSAEQYQQYQIRNSQNSQYSNNNYTQQLPSSYQSKTSQLAQSPGSTVVRISTNNNINSSNLYSPPISSANSYSKFQYPPATNSAGNNINSYQIDSINSKPNLYSNDIRSPSSSYNSVQYNGIMREKQVSKSYQQTLDMFRKKINNILEDPQYLKQEDEQQVSFIKVGLARLNGRRQQNQNIFNNKFNSKQLFGGSLQQQLSSGKVKEMQNKFALKGNDVVKCTPGPKQQSILVQCQRSGQKFVDPEFPPQNSSLSKTGCWWDQGPIPYTDWIRPGEHFRGSYDLFEDGIMPGDIQQGELGDCYFQCTLAALAEWPERIQRIFSTTKKNDQGVYSIWVVWSGVKQEVVIDDNLWYCRYQNRLVSMRTQQNEIWAQLIEKAWAKLNGDYCSIDGGFARDCLHDLTGAPVIHYRIREEAKWQKWQYILWEQLLDGEKQDFIMCAGTYSGKDKFGNYIEGDTQSRDGIFYTHAYSVLGAYQVEVQGVKRNLVKFRNPHGEGEWTGPYSDRDPVWNRISKSEKDRIGYCDENDGVFFMEYQQMRDYFEDVQVCQYRDYYEYEGQFVQSSSGEQPHFFKIEVPCQGHYYFQVNQIARASFAEESSYRYTKATCNVVNQNGQVISACSGRQKNITSYKNQQKYTQIPAGTYYVMAKVLFDQNQMREGVNKFGFGVYGKGKVTIQEVNSVPSNIQNTLLNAVDEVLPNFIM